MKFQRTANSEASIDGVNIPRSGLLMLDALRTSDEPLTGAQIGKAIRGLLPDVVIHQRMAQMKKYGWVIDQSVPMTVNGTPFTKTVWNLTSELREAMTETSTS